jgi:hypothetical protein
MHAQIIRSAAYALLILSAGITVASSTLAQQSDNLEMAPAATYQISWWTIDGGGVSAVTGGGYSLEGTTAQLDAGPQLSGGAYALIGGFWNLEPTGHQIYLPLLLRQ